MSCFRGEAGDSGDHQKALRYAIGRLACRDHGSAELAAKLKRKGFSGRAVERAIATCLRLGYLDDRKFAAGITAIQARKGFGPAKVRALLRAKGLDRETIDQALDQCFGPEIQLAAALTAARKKLRSSKVKSQTDPRPMLWRHLQGRGFPGAIISELLASKKFGDLLTHNKG